VKKFGGAIKFSTKFYLTITRLLVSINFLPVMIDLISDSGLAEIPSFYCAPVGLQAVELSL